VGIVTRRDEAEKKAEEAASEAGGARKQLSAAAERAAGLRSQLDALKAEADAARQVTPPPPMLYEKPAGRPQGQS